MLHVPFKIVVVRCGGEVIKEANSFDIKHVKIAIDLSIEGTLYIALVIILRPDTKGVTPIFIAIRLNTITASKPTFPAIRTRQIPRAREFPVQYREVLP